MDLQSDSVKSWWSLRAWARRARARVRVAPTELTEIPSRSAIVV